MSRIPIFCFFFVFAFIKRFIDHNPLITATYICNASVKQAWEYLGLKERVLIIRTYANKVDWRKLTVRNGGNIKRDQINVSDKKSYLDERDR